MSGVGEVWVSSIGVDEHLLVVALHGEKPWFAQKLQAVEHAWATVDHVSHSNKPVDRFIKSESLQALMKLSGFEVDVTHDKVAASVILREFKQMGHDLRALQKSAWKTTIFYRMAILMWAFGADAYGDAAISNELISMT